MKGSVWERAKWDEVKEVLEQHRDERLQLGSNGNSLGRSEGEGAFLFGLTRTADQQPGVRSFFQTSSDLGQSPGSPLITVNPGMSLHLSLGLHLQLHEMRELDSVKLLSTATCPREYSPLFSCVPGILYSYLVLVWICWFLNDKNPINIQLEGRREGRGRDVIQDSSDLSLSPEKQCI